MVWKIKVQSVFDEDLGYNNLQIEHDLTADIKSTDVVYFELNFTSKGDPYTDRTQDGLAEDSAACEVTINSSDTRFWTVSTYDKYYYCDNQLCNGTYQRATDNTNDWEAYDTDDDPDDPYCTSHSDTTFQCSRLKCKYRRQMITEDDKDFYFYPVAPAGTGDDEMYLTQGRQFVYFNYDGGSNDSNAGNPIRGSIGATTTVAIVSGALSLAAAGATLTALAAF